MAQTWRTPSLPRLLAGLDASGMAMTQAEHERVHGPLPAIAGDALIELVDRSGLRGRGGADFPMATKLRTVAASRRASAVVVNGSETEPASEKDELLLARLPHLVLDGAILAAETIGAGEVIVRVNREKRSAVAALEAAIALRQTRQIRIFLAPGPGGYVSGEESAVINFLGGGPAIPTFVPPRPYERGHRNRPTLIQNPETLGQLALVARHGADWYRELGTAADPGSVLVTVSGAVRDPGVYELAFGTPMADLIEAAGGATERLQALLVGGYFGTWARADEAMGHRLSRSELQAVGCSLGSGVIVALGESACGLHESARIVEWLAGESAGQCGPCVHGLAAIAETLNAVAGGAADGADHDRLDRWCQEVRGRGACHHPNGVVRLVESSLEVFGADVQSHRRGRCHARPAGLPLTAHPNAASREPAARSRRRS